MMKCILFLCCITTLGVASASAQGEAALPFLLLSPSAVSRGMGETSVALFRDDPFASIDNPAHLGMFSRSNYFSAGYDYSVWLPQFQQSDLTLNIFGFNGGVNLKKQFGIAPELSVGLGYSRLRLDLGGFSVTSPDGPEVITTFDAYETADNYSIGVGYHYWISVAAGYTFKQVNSVLSPFNVQGQDRSGSVEFSTYDIGLFLSAPVMEIIGDATGSPVTIGSDVRPLLDLNVGLAKNNMGDEMVVYIDPDQADPQPRYARAGVGIELGFAYAKDQTDWRPVFFSWTRESNDLLVVRYPAPTDSNGNPFGDPPPPGYREGFGDIRFIDDLILGKSNPDAIIKTGWQIDFGEVVSFRGGTYDASDRSGGRLFTTSGYTIRLAGMFKILNLLDVRAESGSILATIMDHIDVRYTRGDVSADDPYGLIPNDAYSSWTLKFSQ